MPAALAHAADDFLVGQHGAQVGTPIHRRFELIGQTMLVAITLDGLFAFLGDVVRDGQFGDRPAALLLVVVPGVEKHEEDELRPAEILDVGGRHFAIPIVAEAEHLQLPAKRVDILLGRLPRMGAGFLGMLLGGQAESVPAHRVHHAHAPHPVEAANDIRRGVTLGMANMKPIAAGVGKHIQNVHFAAFGKFWSLESAIFFPKRCHFGSITDGL